MQFIGNVEQVPADVFYRRDDINDVRLGEVVHVDASDYKKATVVILGCPQDEGVRRNKGRIGASQAPNAIRRALYRLVPPDNAQLILFDAGNTIIQPTLEETHTLQSELVTQFLRDGKRVIVLGGGNDLSYPDCSAVARVFPNPLAINVDAHFDVRADEVRNSGTPYRQLLETQAIQAKDFFEVGNLPMVNSPVYQDYLRQQDAHIIDLDTLLQNGIPHTFNKILEHQANAIFWGIDMDVVHVASAPGVSAPNTLGISEHQLCQIATIAGRDSRSKVFEITEVNPVYDIDGRTARLAATAIHHFLSHLEF